MKFFSTIREFSSIIFNKPNGADIELRPENKTGDSLAEQEIIIPDITDGAEGSPNSDTLALLAATQTFSDKTFSDKVEILGTVSSSYVITPRANGGGTLFLPEAPASSDEITLNTHAQTLEQKTLKGAKISDVAGDNFYTVVPSVWTVDRNITLPNLSADDTFVFEDHTQALTNKTFSALSNTLSDISNANLSASGIANIALNKLAATTANVALKSDASGYLVPSTVTDTELEYLDGVTSSIQTQINSKAGTALDNLTVTSLAAEDLLVASSTSAVGRLGVGLNGQVLTISGGSVTWDNPAGTGDVVGPGASTDNAIVRYDLTTGKVLQDSSVLIDDSNNITGAVGITASATVQGGTLSDGSASLNSGSFSGLQWNTYDTLIDSSKTFTTGTTTFHPGPTIDTGDTITINSGAVLLTGNGIVDGTIINNGTHRVI